VTDPAARPLKRKRFWHCRGPFFHQWGYNAAPMFPLRGCLRDGCDFLQPDFDYKRIKRRAERWGKEE
jgi:hypothetical protein